MRTLCSGPAVPILLLLLVGTVPTRAQTSCLHFPDLLPTKLREMRLKFEEIKDYFGSLGCQAVSEMISFYMDEVLPSAARSSMHRNGIYKAMGEFDIFINYIEKYLTMGRRK
ncbi:interleukin-10-like [Malurus melanocephalus]|uniref:interleukin-10-like n=1 Tax=Malurus melanocephalus TaxID=175006 RepID=UPI002546E900|nr:interleukin-10-like [Malurus melanocephalus]